jgi:hypothetical protein
LSKNVKVKLTFFHAYLFGQPLRRRSFGITINKQTNKPFSLGNFWRSPLGRRRSNEKV